MSKASVHPGTSAAKTSLPVASRPGTRKPTTIAAEAKKDMAKVPTSSDRNFIFARPSSAAWRGFDGDALLFIEATLP